MVRTKCVGAVIAAWMCGAAMGQVGGIEGVVIVGETNGEVIPIGGASLLLFDSELDGVGEVFSEEDGSYLFEGVASGVYYLVAIGDGFDGMTAEVIVPPDGLAEQGFELGVLRLCEECAYEDIALDVGLGAYVASSGDGHGPGAIFSDLNSDGYPDLYLIRAGLPNMLYLNVEGDDGGRRFRVPARFAGAGDRGLGTGAIAGDYDNDGDTDIYVLNFNQPSVLLQNQLAQTGSLWFEDVTAATDPTPGVDDDQFGVGLAVFDGVVLDNSLTAAWADPDRDGDLDLYVGNHDGFFGNPVERDVPGQRDIFYINNGDGTFTDATMFYGVTGYETEDGGFETADQWFSSTNAVIFADFDNDTWADLLVTNKIGGPDDRDMLYLNLGVDGHGHWRGFTQVTYDLVPTFGNMSGAAMGVDAGDIDNDGDLDIYITDFSVFPGLEGNNDLWVNQLSETGVLGFEHFSELDAAFSWGVQMLDLDNRGFPEVHVATDGLFRDYLYTIEHELSELAREAGLAQRRNSRSSVSADMDLDGWPELFVVNVDGGASSLFYNRIGLLGSENHHLTLRLVGGPGTLPLASSRDTIGTTVYVSADLNGDGEIGPRETMRRDVTSGSSNAASTASIDLEFGLWQAQWADVTILWMSGRVEYFRVDADRYMFIPDCIADMSGSGNPFDPEYGVPDGSLGAEDFFFYLDVFAAGDPRADLTGATQPGQEGYAIPDGRVDADDFFFYLDRFVQGCSLD